MSDVRISCLFNARYHASREAFLDGVHRWFMFAVIVLSAGALIDVVGHWAKDAFAAGTVVLAALDLTFDLSNRARSHGAMKRRYFEALAELMEGRRSAIDTRACLDRFAAEEEPVHHAVLCACWNAAVESVRGDDGDHYVIPWRYRVTAQWLRHESVRFAVSPNSPVTMPPPATWTSITPVG